MVRGRADERRGVGVLRGQLVRRGDGAGMTTSGELAGDVRHPGRLAPLPVHVLLVEDDEGDAFLVRELLLDAGSEIALSRAHSLAEAELMLPGDVDCVLLDLGLPDASGLDG